MTAATPSPGDPAAVERLGLRLLSGLTRLRLPHDGRRRTFWFAEPPAAARAAAAEAAFAAKARALRAGLPTAAGAVEDLRSRGLWAAADDAALAAAEADLDKLRRAVWDARRRPPAREAVRRTLRAAEAKRDALLARRNQTFHATADGAAAAAKTRHLVGAGLRHADQVTPVWAGRAFLSDRSRLLDAAAAAVLAARPPEAALRAAVRADPWRSAWAAREFADPFGGLAADWGDDRRAAVAWGRLYDRAREDPDGPDDDLLGDDDVVDGWVASLKGVAAKRPPEVAASEKVRNAPQVFVLTDESDPNWGGLTAAAVADLNDPVARAIQEKTLRKAAAGGG